ncbi:uncharacterized protein PFLUO_LOCUS4335 [Penicillium psychrofluorescens]|uniref:uncharacterized protein n=1 Tax=Penicillium psychrofluorescens TaxID=3158075 RepID=UPI003CCDF748
MRKTYEDAFQFRGMTGGDWAYVSNTNETAGKPCLSPPTTVPASGRRLGIYILGWESIELHEDASLTPEFAVEIDKLKPHFGPGTGAWYALFKKHHSS